MSIKYNSWTEEGLHRALAVKIVQERDARVKADTLVDEIQAIAAEIVRRLPWLEH